MKRCGWLLLTFIAGCGRPTPDADAAAIDGSIDAAIDFAGDQKLADAGLDLVADDLAGDRFCTTIACARKPCSPGCAFVPPAAGACDPSAPATIARADAIACPRFCGLIPFVRPFEFGCLRFRFEDAACRNACDPWGTASCFEQRPALDYRTSGAICDDRLGFFCDDGAPADAGTRDCGH